MVPEIDIWRAANLLIRQHGDVAEIVAARRADELLDRDDRDGQMIWQRIRRTIAELTSGTDRAISLTGDWLLHAFWYGIAFVAALVVAHLLSLAFGFGSLPVR